MCRLFLPLPSDVIMCVFFVFFFAVHKVTATFIVRLLTTLFFRLLLLLRYFTVNWNPLIRGQILKMLTLMFHHSK